MWDDVVSSGNLVTSPASKEDAFVQKKLLKHLIFIVFISRYVYLYRATVIKCLEIFIFATFCAESIWIQLRDILVVVASFILIFLHRICINLRWFWCKWSHVWVHFVFIPFHSWDDFYHWKEQRHLVKWIKISTCQPNMKKSKSSNASSVRQMCNEHIPLRSMVQLCIHYAVAETPPFDKLFSSFLIYVTKHVLFFFYSNQTLLNNWNKVLFRDVVLYVTILLRAAAWSSGVEGVKSLPM